MAAARDVTRGQGSGRYAIFLIVIGLSLVSPAVPHKTEPNMTWWLVAAAILALMLAVGYLGSLRERGHWLNTLAPLLLFPAIHALRCADGNAASGFNPLIFVPVVWFALYGVRMRDVLLAVAGGALTVFAPMLLIGSPQFPASSWRGSLLLVIVSAALGPLVYRLVESTSRANRRLARSESEFRAAFENAPVGMAITGLRGGEQYRFLRVNRALCEMFGRSKAELTSAPITVFTHPDDLVMSQDAFARSADPDTVPRVEKRYLHKSGRTIWASVTYSVVLDEDGEPSHLISQIEDLGQRRESAQALLDAFETDRAADERMERLERVRAEMASTVSHELRTPLTSASGYVELLVEGDAGPLTEEQRSMLDIVSRSLSRLDGIVGDVLSMARTDTGDSAKELSRTDIGEVLRSALATVALQAATRGQDLIVTNAVDGVLVTGQPSRMERLFTNLLTNALKFTADDGTITIVATREARDVRVQISDTGIGISQEDQQRIFERFYRADQTFESSASGTGLGLSIVLAIVRQYGGTIAVDSELGKGSTFTLTFPIKSLP